jgi:hypothetical protein
MKFTTLVLIQLSQHTHTIDKLSHILLDKLPEVNNIGIEIVDDVLNAVFEMTANCQINRPAADKWFPVFLNIAGYLV